MKMARNMTRYDGKYSLFHNILLAGNSYYYFLSVLPTEPVIPAGAW